jgi:hypothetical protein
LEKIDVHVDIEMDAEELVDDGSYEPIDWEVNETIFVPEDSYICPYQNYNVDGLHRSSTTTTCICVQVVSKSTVYISVP